MDGGNFTRTHRDVAGGDGPRLGGVWRGDGLWRAPEQALFTAVKLPLVLLLTALGNALLNAMLAPLLGVNIGLRQSLLAVLMSFTIAGAILGGVAPLLAFVIWNAPPLARSASAGTTHAFILLTIVAAIAFAGVAANLRLLRLLERLGGSASVARRVLFAWLAVNLFLGSQLAWILRPFVGSRACPCNSSATNRSKVVFTKRSSTRWDGCSAREETFARETRE